MHVSAQVCVWKDIQDLEKMVEVFFFLSPCKTLSKIQELYVPWFENYKIVIHIYNISFMITDSPRNPLLVLLISPDLKKKPK